jgi:branched-chain amino acid transport system substrate-binding protein
MAIEDFKAQFKPSFKIELVSADHQNKADVGSNKVREWYDTQGVDMVTDVLNSGVALAVAKVTTGKEQDHDQHRRRVDAPDQRGLRAEQRGALRL